ncbi:putative reverse transcriptase domain-containing protein [Tanacetum coccineum]
MMKIQLRLLSDIVIKINYLLTAFALLSICFAFAAADEDLSPLAVEDLHNKNFYCLMTMPNTRSGILRTCEGINEQIVRQMAGALRACSTTRNLEPLMRDEGGQEEVNGGNGNGGNENWIEAAYAMSWAELMKLMTEVYCPRNEVQKMETELWNLVVKGNDLTAYTRRFQELGNVITAEPTKLQDAIRVANNLMDQKLKGYARSAENKRRMWQELTQLGTMRKRGMLDCFPTATSASCTMQGRVL